MIKFSIALLIIICIALFIRLLVVDYDKCYYEMVQEGHASMGCCHGLAGGTRSTDYLSEVCVECPYLTLIDKEEKKDD